MLWVSLVGAATLQALVMYVPAGRELFGMVPLATHDWLLVVGVAGSILLIEEGRKLVVRRMGA